MTGLSNAKNVVLDSDTYHLIESLSRALSTNDLSHRQSAIDDSLKLCNALLAQFDTHPLPPSNAITLPFWKEKKAKELISSNISAHIPIARIAKECSLSRSHFSRAFKKSTGYSPKAWLTQRRIQRAQELLMSGTVPLAQIGFECGFADQSHFTRTFTKHLGLAPTRWRKKQSAALSPAVSPG